MQSIRPFRFGNVAFVVIAALGSSSVSCGSDAGPSGPSEAGGASSAGTSTREGVGGQGSSSAVGLTAAGGAGDTSRHSTGSIGGATAAGATSGSNGGSSNGGSSNALDDYTGFCSKVASTVCSAISDCCGMTRSDCEVGYGKLCLRQWDLSAATYFPDRGKACLPLLPDMFDGCEYQPAESEAYRTAQLACEQVVVGSVPAGGLCSNDRYCATDASSASVCRDDGSGSSKCAVVPLIAIDAACGNAVAGRCVAGSFCDATKQVCMLQRKTGEGCDSPMQCLSYHCDAGICKPATTAGICSNISP